MDYNATDQMSSRKFWETTGRNKYRAKADIFADSLIDKKTGLLYKKFAFKRRCLICDKDKPEILFVKKGFHYVRCNECGMVYTNPALKDSIYKEMYEKEACWDEFIEILKTENQRKYDEIKFNYGLDKVSNFVSSGKTLDIGCSIGVFLEVAQKRGWEAYGLELNKKAYEYARNNKLNVDNKMLNHSKYAGIKFDLITMWDVLEHAVYPKKLLSSTFNQLADNGALLVLTPNINSLAARVMHKECNVFEGSSHVSLFSVETLKRILEESGFCVVHMETIISEINVLNNFLSYKHPYQGDINKSDSLLSLVTEQDVLKNKLGYKSLAVAVKKS